MNQEGVHCTKCVYFEADKLWCARYKCEIATKLTLRIECLDFKRKPIRFGSESRGEKRKWQI